ncbi:HTH-type transcriptional regulator / antitoxin HipB [Quadrisphaera granulorum]|uniref:HTH-type transcriptional regulator/antitoxin HipB n=1 Tax=Quadrisphaera granulorum TaxID=317664 RepID=A0A315ZVL2_9ACTN|nr:helix-turn-helix transcriptional regulator [Quadrisphaera granulorum]PWJ48664.1 HTH-type transcriptional regulator/antitoxin HipB [Quadrisphaera granulorum]SZE98386.1 HTH-type transcriptional regulator / antitoxin HipB [Quadrisphaera granulorum]
MEQKVTTTGQLGRLVSARRHDSGLSQRALATTMGFSQRYLSEIESGALGLKAQRLLDLLDELGIDLVARPRT